MDLSSINESLATFQNRAATYFGSLDLYEKVAWGTVALGLVLIITGLVML